MPKLGFDPSRATAFSPVSMRWLALWGGVSDYVTVAPANPYPTREDRAAFVDRRLAELYPHPAIPLEHRDAYTLLVAVLLSAQCTDKRVNLTTPRLFALANTPEKM